MEQFLRNFTLDDAMAFVHTHSLNVRELRGCSSIRQFVLMVSTDPAFEEAALLIRQPVEARIREKFRERELVTLAAGLRELDEVKTKMATWTSSVSLASSSFTVGMR